MNDLFLRACRLETVERTPIWLMRQAGRSLPEYRELRTQHGFATLMSTPDLAARVTIQPIDRLGVDAAILFSDILVPAAPLGLKVEFTPGPVLESPVRSASDIDGLHAADPEESVPWVFETLRILRRELEGRVPVIGFAATPFTLAAYLVEGGGSKSFGQVKRLLFGDSPAAHRLLERVTAVTERYVAAQVRAGAQAIQLFDSWAGLLSIEDYREFNLRYTRRVFDSLADGGVPRIYFGLDAAHLMDAVRECGADVIGLDWRNGLVETAERLGGGFAIQGNLDPGALLTTPAVVTERALRVLDDARSLPGHIFNLGHGVPADTPLDNLFALVRTVQGAVRTPG